VIKDYSGIVSIALLFTLIIVISPLASAQTPTQSTPPGYKVAFIADQGLGSDSEAVLNLILNEGADMVLHQGDFDYIESPNQWDNQINGILGKDYPYFASVGNHDAPVWSGYQQKLIDRLARIDGAVCTGDIGVKASCTYNGLFFILSGAGTMGSGHANYIRDQMAADDSIWKICTWHKNMGEMQVGGKSIAMKGQELCPAYKTK